MIRLRRIFAIGLALVIVGGILGAKAKKDDDSDHAVSIKDMKFSPASITIKPGQTVTWTNNDDHDHTVTADDGSFKSDKLGHGDTFQHKFEKKGKYKYACSYHPREKGTVVVSGD